MTPESSGKSRIVSPSFGTKKVCPHCGHDEFELAERKLSWLFGQKYVCGKCTKTFVEVFGHRTGIGREIGR